MIFIYIINRDNNNLSVKHFLENFGIAMKWNKYIKNNELEDKWNNLYDKKLKPINLESNILIFDNIIPYAFYLIAISHILKLMQNYNR